MADLVVTCGVRRPELQAKAKAQGHGQGHGQGNKSEALESLDVATAQTLAVPWSDVLSFSPDVFAFSSLSAVDAALGGPEAGILLSRWRGALFAGVGPHTTHHLAGALARVFTARPPRPWTPPETETQGEGLEALLAALPPEAHRVVVFGARGGKAEHLSSSRHDLLAVACYELVPLPGLDAAFRALFARCHAGKGPTVTLRVGSGALAHIVCAALTEAHLLEDSQGWLFFEARHASARAAIEGLGLGGRLVPTA